MSQTTHPHRQLLCRGRLGVLCTGLTLLAAALYGPGRSAAQRPRDPVYDLKEALKVDRNVFVEGASAHREKTLKEAADKVQALGDLAQVMLLSDWLPEADKAVLKSIVDRFQSKLRSDLSVEKSDATRQAAAAVLVRETVAKTRTIKFLRTPPLSEPLANVVPDLIAVVKAPGTTSATRAAAVAALGEIEPVFVKDPVGDSREDVVKPEALRQWVKPELGAIEAVLKEQLRSAGDPAVRIAAGQALVDFTQGLSLFAAYHRPPNAVTDAKSKQDKQLSDVTDEYRVQSLVLILGAATGGLKDSDRRVRASCVEVCKSVAVLVAFNLIRSPFDPVTSRFPPGGRDWSAAERKDVERARAEVVALRGLLAPLLKAFQNAVPAVADAATNDPDPLIRVESNRVLEYLSLVRQNLVRLEDSVPREKPSVDEARLDANVIRLPIVSGPALAPQPIVPRAAPKASAAAVGRPVAFREEKKGDDPLEGSLLKKMSTIEKSLSDPDLRVRLAALDALETMGADAAPARPALIRALTEVNPASDYKFVRWSAARVLGKLAPRDEASFKALGPQEQEAIRASVKTLGEFTGGDHDLDVRMAATAALERYGPVASPAVPYLSIASQQGDAEPRIAAMHALQSIGVPAAHALRDIARNLPEGNYRIRQAACEALGQIGALALAAETDTARKQKWKQQIADWLRPVLTDHNADVRRAASDALLRVLGM